MILCTISTGKSSIVGMLNAFLDFAGGIVVLSIRQSTALRSMSVLTVSLCLSLLAVVASGALSMKILQSCLMSERCLLSEKVEQNVQRRGPFHLCFALVGPSIIMNISALSSI